MDPDPPLAVTLSLPAGWHSRRDLGHGVVLAARPTPAPAGVCPEIVVRCAPVDTDLVTWRRQALHALRAQLPGFALHGTGRLDLAGRRVAHCRFSHRLGTAEVVSDQWAWQVGDVGVTLTCSAAQEDHPAYLEVFAGVAATFDVVPRAA